ncbi:hypothetical protein HanRHA438_Chr01g0003781 [Helianthus annuus]|nr:hypothetical protein HanRHA438_Chr01g0003781 [Helianthus annuus]
MVGDLASYNILKVSRNANVEDLKKPTVISQCSGIKNKIEAKAKFKQSSEAYVLRSVQVPSLPSSSSAVADTKIRLKHMNNQLNKVK